MSTRSRQARQRSLLAAALVVLALIAGSRVPAPVTAADEPLRLIVEVKPEVGIASDDAPTNNALRSDFVSAPPASVDVLLEVPDTRYVAVEVAPGDLGELAEDPRVARLEVDHEVRAQDTPGQTLMNLEYATVRHRTGNGVRVAVFDTGVDSTHPSLTGRVQAGGCFIDPTYCPVGSGLAAVADDNGHGTAVASVIASGGGGGVEAGIAPDVTIYAYKVLDSNGIGFVSEVLAGLSSVYANPNGIDVINLSLSGAPSSSCDGGSYGSMVTQLRTVRGILVIASAGNGGSTSGIGAPACATSAISVGAVYSADVGGPTYSLGGSATCSDATTTADQIPCYSNTTTATDGNGQPLLDVLAPADCTLAAAPGGGTTSCFGGTSAAAAYVSGAAAVLLSVGLSPDQVDQRLRIGTTVTDPRNGLARPRIDLQAALSAPGTTRNVDAADSGCGPSGPTYCTIQTAISAASPLDVIQVAAGTYHENVDVVRDLTIAGAGVDLTVIDGGGTGEALRAEDVAATLRNLTLRNGGPAQSSSVEPTLGVWGTAYLDASALAVRDGLDTGVHVETDARAVWNGGAVTGNGDTGIEVRGQADLTGVDVGNNTVIGSSTYGGGIAVQASASYIGRLTMTGGSVTGNSAIGGAGLANRGVATLTDVTVSGNHVLTSSGLGDLVPEAGNGGGISNVSQPATPGTPEYGTKVAGSGVLTLVRVTITGNEGRHGGAGLFNAGIADLEGGVIEGNYTTTPSSGAGTGIRNVAFAFEHVSTHDRVVLAGTGELTANGTLIGAAGGSPNMGAWHGGGIANSGTATLTNVVVRNTSAQAAGGAIYNAAPGQGTGVNYEGPAILSMTGGAIIDASSRDGGGLFVGATADVTLDGVQIAGNAVASSNCGPSPSVAHGAGVYIEAGGQFSATHSAFGDNTSDHCGTTEEEDVEAAGSTTYDLTANWWGCAEGPATCGVVYATADLSTWVAELALSASASAPTTGTAVTVTGSLLDQDGASLGGAPGLLVSVTGANPRSATLAAGSSYSLTGSTPGDDVVTASYAATTDGPSTGLSGTVEIAWASPAPPPAGGGGGGGGGGGAPAGGGGGGAAPTPTPPPVPTRAAEPGGVSVPLHNGTASKIEPNAGASLQSSSDDGTSARVDVAPGTFPDGTTVTLGAVVDLDALVSQAPPPARASVILGFQVTATAEDGTALTRDFANPVTLEFTVPATALPAGARPEDLVVAFWNGASWVEVAGSVTTGAGGQLVFSVSTDHFTLFSVLHRPGASSTGVFAENLPRSGVALATWGGGTIQQAFTLRTPTGGRLVSIWTFVGGRPVGYAAASPDFANARFRALFPGDVIPAGTPLLLVIE